MLEIEFPVMRYDITLPLLEERVPIEGVSLRPTKRVSSMVTSEDSPLYDGSFGLADLNLGYFVPAIEAGWEIVGLPIFSKRKPVYGFLFCRADRGIDSPADLAGRRIGTRQYRTAITVWMRGLLKEHHGVDLGTCEWVVSAGEVFPVYDEHTRIVRAEDPSKSPIKALLDGNVDAIVTDISDGALLQSLETNPNVKRLFPNYQEEDLRLYRSTGIYTPVHLMVMSKRLDREHPELAGQLYAAFEQAKKIAYDDTLGDRGGFSVVYVREALVEQMRVWGDPWKYGVAANRGTLETFARYNAQQGMTRGQLSMQDMFAAGTLGT